MPLKVLVHNLDLIQHDSCHHTTRQGYASVMLVMLSTHWGRFDSTDNFINVFALGVRKGINFGSWNMVSGNQKLIIKLCWLTEVFFSDKTDN